MPPSAEGTAQSIDRLAINFNAKRNSGSQVSGARPSSVRPEKDTSGRSIKSILKKKSASPMSQGEGDRSFTRFNQVAPSIHVSEEHPAPFEKYVERNRKKYMSELPTTLMDSMAV